MRFGQNVLRMTWKERFVQFSWKAHCFPVLNWISGQFHDFENLDAQKCDLAKTCSAWPETSVLYSFHRKRTVFPFWREFQASVTILKTLTLKNAIWPKRAAHDLKTAFCTIFMVSALFCRFEENLRPVLRFWELWRSEMRFGQIVLRKTWKERFVQFLSKAHGFPFLERISGHCDDFENFDAQNAIWPKRAAYDLKRAFCTIFIKSALFFLFWENFRPVWRFWELWRSQMRFGQNVLRMTWKECFVQFSWKAHSSPVLKRIWGQCDDFENFHAQKSYLAKTCCVLPEKSVLYNFYKKRTVFPVWREFQTSVTILRTFTLKIAIWPKLAAHDLKRAFCTIFMESAHFENFDARKYDLTKICSAWLEKSVLYKFYKKRTVFPLWREFQTSVTILRTLTLKNAIRPKRAAHELKGAFCTIFIKSALFSRFEENFRPVWQFWKLWRSEMRFGQNVLRMTWKQRFVLFSW